ncbi:DUF6093 family protein [Streptomyces liangshanensis]|uniref:DUF6093 family protein n=1 Tax=Streptomyces liangshanensis TaxID=2717324 RepID=UPI0036DD03C6
MSALEAALAAGRAAANQLQREVIQLHRPGEREFDWETGTDTPAEGSVLYEGRARVKASAQSKGEEVDAGERNVTLREYVVSVSWATEPPITRPEPGDLITVNSSPDARMVGLTLWVTGLQYSSTATAWRISAEDRS